MILGLGFMAILKKGTLHVHMNNAGSNGLTKRMFQNILGKTLGKRAI